MAPDPKNAQKQKITGNYYGNNHRRQSPMRHLLMFVLLSSLIAPGIQAANMTVSGEQDLIIFYSNDVIGETDPCG